MRYINTVILLAVLTLSACAVKPSGPAANTPASTTIYWVNSAKVHCTGVAPMQCLQVQKTERAVADGWELFYDAIEGFDYKPGYIYKLSVRERHLPPEQVPADASSIKYTLLKVLEKKPDARLRLNDIWVLDAIQEQKITPGPKQKRPQLEIHLADMKVMGNNGCNLFTGEIQHLDAKKIELGPIAATRKLCMDMSIPRQFNLQIDKVQSYTIKDLKLYLLDDTGEPVLVFKKVD